MKNTLGVIFGNRDFFPDHLVTEARKDINKLFKDLAIEGIMLSEKDSKLGGVETFMDARKCAELFKKHRDAIEGVLVVLPNFGDEKGVADVSALGAALIAGIGSQIFANMEELEAIQQQQHTYHPLSERTALLSAYQGWKREVENL